MNNKRRELMKKMNSMVMAMALLTMALPMNAQTNKNKQQESLVKKVTTIWNNAKKQVKQTGKDIGEKIGFDDMAAKEQDTDLIEVDGMKYMPIYNFDLFVNSHTTEDVELVRLSREAFMKKYPNAEIMYAVVPQQDWLHTALRDGSKVTGYRRRAYCFVVAKDGSDGYLNARFLFSAERVAGGEYVKSNSWPRWERTDVIPSHVYPKLIK
ncbi:MAG: Tat pathway signal sequence [Segatella oris]|uniref:Tat pathway signal sequence n=1 Tax=Segatella oris TaxID=28135 RepID=UPI003FA21D36